MADPNPSPLQVQIALEKAEIDNAPRVSLGGNVGICNWCGRVSQNLVLVEVVNGIGRYKGGCCNGGNRHG